MNNDRILDETHLRFMFEENFERLRAENGHSIAPELKEMAWQQVRMYWLKLRHIAEKVTDTEVHLNLPNQRTKSKRPFCIEGIVDIVREGDKTIMYDIKTHELSHVKDHIDIYQDQLNVYAYIWQNLRGQPLNETAVIATPLPAHIKEAVRNTGKDISQLLAACESWDPVVPIPVDPTQVRKTIEEFATTVDDIEENKFSSCDLGTLESRESDRGTFGTRVCRNCDGRFSCSSYREYGKKHKDLSWTKMAAFFDCPIDESELEDEKEVLIPLGENSENEVKEI